MRWLPKWIALTAIPLAVLLIPFAAPHHFLLPRWIAALGVFIAFVVVTILVASAIRDRE